MKIILVDAVNTLFIKEIGLNQEMYKLLESYPNPKIILTNANHDQIKMLGLDELPYQIFTLCRNPDKTAPSYYKKMLNNYKLLPKDVVYIEHNIDSVKSAKSLRINTFHYDVSQNDLEGLKIFLDQNL